MEPICLRAEQQYDCYSTYHPYYFQFAVTVHTFLIFEFDGKVTEKSVNKGKSNKIIIGEKKQK